MLLELLLQWEAFLCVGKMERQVVKRLKQKHKYIMYVLKQVANRRAHMGLKLL